MGGKKELLKGGKSVPGEGKQLRAGEMAQRLLEVKENMLVI